jgi:type II secretory pathway component GspD/PulD (secretin)
MGTTRPHQRQGHRIWGGIASLLVILLLVPIAQLGAGAPHLQVAVHQGRLSVNLWEADLGEVLAQIHQQAGISFRVSPSPQSTVSIQFTDMALDQGLRRVLQLASRSYAMHYGVGLTGEATLQEVQVFAEAPAGDQNPAGAAHAKETPGAEVSQRFVDAMLQRQAAALTITHEDESDTASHVRDALARHSAPAPGGTDAPESDAVRGFRDALEDFGGATPR